MENDAFRRGIVELLPRLRRFAYALTGTKADADDLLQATVERLLTRDIPAGVDVAKWSFRVCKNIWIDELRARNVRQRAVTNGNIDDREESDGADSVFYALALSEVDEAMKQLPEEQRAALALITLEGYSYAEAAEALDAPIGTIMSRISRARSALNKMFSDNERPPRKQAKDQKGPETKR